MRYQMSARLALTALVFAAAAGSVSAQPTLYVEGAGASGLYAIGAEQVLFRSADGDQAFSVRAGAGYWTERSPFLDGGTETYLSAPLAGAASFALGRLPLAIETTGGVVFGFERVAFPGRDASTSDLVALPYGELALRASVTRDVSARVGAVVGGRHDFVTGGPVAPVLSVGYAL